jgi:serine/threonine protein kinase
MRQVNDRIKHYTITKLVNQGAFCDAFFAIDDSGVEYFMKEYNDPTEMSPEFRKFFSNQEIIMDRLNKMGSITEKFIEHFMFDKHYFQVKREISGMDLDKWLADNSNYDKRLQIGVILTGVIRQLHNANIVHQDLKPAQVMLAEDDLGRKTKLGFRIMLSDFDWSIPDGKMAKLVTSPGYSSPEHLQNKIPVKESDIFTLGLILCEILTGSNPFVDDYGLVPDDFKTRILRKNLFHEPKYYNSDLSDDINSLILSCLEPDKTKRPKSDYIQNILLGTGNKGNSITRFTLSSSKGSYIFFENRDFGRADFKRFFGNLLDEKSNSIHMYCDEAKTMLRFTLNKTFFVSTPVTTKNYFLLNGTRLGPAPVELHLNDKLEFFSTAQSKTVAVFQVKP